MKTICAFGMALLTSANSFPSSPVSGYYSWNWGSGSIGASDANMGIAFTGLINVGEAISGYTEGAAWCCPKLTEPKLLTLGGGNAAGMFTAKAL